jgi:hypothetical protein
MIAFDARAYIAAHRAARALRLARKAIAKASSASAEMAIMAAWHQQRQRKAWHQSECGSMAAWQVASGSGGVAGGS